jgi:hypothetical protein
MFRRQVKSVHRHFHYLLYLLYLHYLLSLLCLLYLPAFRCILLTLRQYFSARCEVRGE